MAGYDLLHGKAARFPIAMHARPMNERRLANSNRLRPGGESSPADRFRHHRGRPRISASERTRRDPPLDRPAIAAPRLTDNRCAGCSRTFGCLIRRVAVDDDDLMYALSQDGRYHGRNGVFLVQAWNDRGDSDGAANRAYFHSRALSQAPAQPTPRRTLRAVDRTTRPCETRDRPAQFQISRKVCWVASPRV